MESYLGPHRKIIVLKSEKRKLAVGQARTTVVHCRHFRYAVLSFLLGHLLGMNCLQMVSHGSESKHVKWLLIQNIESFFNRIADLHSVCPKITNFTTPLFVLDAAVLNPDSSNVIRFCIYICIVSPFSF